jgi:hypothetical protein
MTKAKKFKLGPKQKKWLKALKSGEYKQCKATLCNGNGGYCCLGVANEVLSLGESETEILNNTYEDLGLHSAYGDIDDGYKFPRGKKTYFELTDMNDNGITHAKIAEFIEQNPEKVFTKSI